MGGEDGFVKILADGHIMYQKMSKTYGSVFTPKRRSHKYNFCGLPLPSQVAFECIELFAGKARLTSAQRLSGRSAVKLDLNYLGKDAEGRQVMDITTPEGMALLGFYGERFSSVSKHVILFLRTVRSISWVHFLNDSLNPDSLFKPYFVETQKDF